MRFASRSSPSARSSTTWLRSASCRYLRARSAQRAIAHHPSFFDHGIPVLDSVLNPGERSSTFTIGKNMGRLSLILLWVAAVACDAQEKQEAAAVLSPEERIRELEARVATLQKIAAFLARATSYGRALPVEGRRYRHEGLGRMKALRIITGAIGAFTSLFTCAPFAYEWVFCEAVPSTPTTVLGLVFSAISLAGAFALFMSATLSEGQHPRGNRVLRARRDSPRPFHGPAFRAVGELGNRSPDWLSPAGRDDP